MIPREICRILAKYLTFLSISLCLPLALAVYYQFFAAENHPQPHSTPAFLYTIVICLAIALGLYLAGKRTDHDLYRRDGILLVVLLWILTSCVSALPFYFSGTLSNPIDAYFEAMSGLTTTGSTMISPKAYNPETGAEIPIYITNPNMPNATYSYWGTVAPVRDPENGLVLFSGVEAVGKAILFWRSLLQWIGGMGIVVLFLTVLPALGVGGRVLYQMETTSTFKDELTPRVRETASQLWKLYLLLTLLEVVLLLWTDRQLPLFDAICIAFSNISTGGFSVRNDSIASYASPGLEWVVVAFMILGSINFALYFHVLRGKFYRIYVPDFFLFFAVAIVGALLVSSFLIGQNAADLAGPGGTYSVGRAFQQGIFQAISFQSSTGFVTANYDRWPFPCQTFMLILMFIGGMSGSTSGGIKASRFYILYKIVLHRLESLYRPDSIRKLRIGPTEVDDKHALTVLSFFCIVAFFAVFGTTAFIIDGIDPETSLGLTASLLNNVGSAFGAAGPAYSLGFLSNFDKIIGTVWMLLGRLEFYVVLLLLLPSFWKTH